MTLKISHLISYLLIALVLVVAGFYLTKEQGEAAISSSSMPAVAYAPLLPAPQAADLPAEQTGYVYAVDTDIDGSFTLDSQGHFVADQLALSLFDHFFISAGDIPEEAIAEAIQQWIGQQLAEPARGEALDFLQSYLAFRALARDYYEANEMPVDPSERFALIRQLRMQAYGEDLYRQLFAEQDRADLARMQRIQRSLETGERSDDLSSMTPAEQRVSSRSNDVSESMRIAAETDNAEDRWVQRNEQFGHEAAYRLAELDRSRVHWQQRVDSYQQRRSVIEQDASLAEEKKEEKISQMLTEEFNDSEISRLKALERIEKSEG